MPCDTVAGAFQIKDGVLNLGQRRNIRMNWVTDSQIAYDTKNTYHYAWNVYNVDFSNTAVAPILQASIDKAEALIEEQGGYMGYEEDILMPEALSAAKDIVLNASASAKEMFDRQVKSPKCGVLHILRC